MSGTAELSRRLPGALMMLVGLLTALLLVSWAASIGPSQALRGDGNDPETSDVRERLGSDAGSETATAPPIAQPDGSHGWVDAVATVLGVLLLGLFGRILLTTARRSARERASRDRGEERLIVDVLPRAETVTDHAAAQRQELVTGGSPRNAIVACWDRLEHDIAAGGLPRRAWETSSEFVLRFLGELDPDPRAARRLAALYREARHSAHPMTEDDRKNAVDALDDLHDSLMAHR